MVNLDNGELLQPKKRRRRRRRTNDLSKSSGLLRPATLAISAGLVLLGAWWYLTQDARVTTAHQAEVGGSFQPHPADLAQIAQAPQSGETTSSAPNGSNAVSTPVVFPNYVTVSEPAQADTRKDDVRREANTDASATAAKEAKAEKAKADALKAKQLAKDAARQRDKAKKDAETIEHVAEARVTAPVAPTPAPAPKPTPEQTCQGQAFLSRAVCMQTQCSQAANANTLQCKRMFEMQEALRRGSGG